MIRTTKTISRSAVIMSSAQRRHHRKQFEGIVKHTKPKLYLDYDSTISENSTVLQQLQVINAAIGQSAGGELVAQRKKNMDEIVARVGAEHKNLMQQFLSLPKKDFFDGCFVDKLLEEMANYETKWNTIVEEALLLQGIKEQDFLKAAEHTPLQKYCLSTIEKCFKEGLQIAVLSVNWSRDWIKRSLSCKSETISLMGERQDSKLQVFANELVYNPEDSVSTGKLIKNMESAKDKGDCLKELCEVQIDKETKSIFIGDSLIDMKALLLADLGIVLGDNKDLRSILELCKVDLRPLNAFSDFSFSSPKAEGPCLFSAKDWKQIEDILFGVNSDDGFVPRVLVIAGSDSGGGAGIQADLKTCMATGSFGTTVVTAITSQNTHGVQAVHPIPSDHIQSQINSVLSDLGTDVVKTGMLSSAEMVKLVAEVISSFNVNTLVIDPVMVSTSGHTLATRQVIEAMIEYLFPLCTVLCPNIKEAEILTGKSITNLAEMKEAAKILQSIGPSCVLMKGGHLNPEETSLVVDVVYDGVQMMEIKHPRVHTDRLHGTGCTLASAIASYLAQGQSCNQAIQSGIDFLQEALIESTSMKLGNGSQLPFNHGYRLHHWPVCKKTERIMDLTLYAITDEDYNSKHNRSLSEAAAKALEGGVSILQVREKHKASSDFLRAVKIVQEVASGYQVPIVVNDRVDVALASEADGVHIGQEDIPAEVVRRMIGWDKILGVSVSTKYQAIAAEKAGADYIGVGAIYPTPSKDSSAIGVRRLIEIRNSVQIPIVAIGGISTSNVKEVMDTGIQGIALISALFDQKDIFTATREIRNLIMSAKSSQPLS